MSAIDSLGRARDHVHEWASATKPTQLQKFVRAVREICIGSQPIQSTRDGLCEPLNLNTVRVSSLRMTLEVADEEVSQALRRPLKNQGMGCMEDACMDDALHVQCGGFALGR